MADFQPSFWRGSQTQGYYRGFPMYGGQGSGMGDPVMAGSTSYSAGQGGTGAATGGYPPSVIYMVVLVIVEMFFFAWLAKHV